LHQTTIFDVHAVEMQTPSAIRISREPGAQNHSTLAISRLMECPKTEELACERRPQTHRAVIESSTACPFSHERGPAGPRLSGGGRSYPQQNEHAHALAAMNRHTETLRTSRKTRSVSASWRLLANPSTLFAALAPSVTMLIAQVEQELDWLELSPNPPMSRLVSDRDCKHGRRSPGRGPAPVPGGCR
jgi:hypothetical protein